jgi:hypothetical protein
MFANSKVFCIIGLIHEENINDRDGVAKVFLMIKIGLGLMCSLVFSLINV